MKKPIIAISSFLAGVLIMASIPVFSSTGLQKITANINHTIFLKLNGQKVETEYPIITYNGRTYVYLKEVGELVGASVEWNNDERSVEIQTELQNDNLGMDMLNKIEDYENNYEAYEYNNVIYIPLSYGLKKYDLRSVYSFDSDRNMLIFLKINKYIDIKDQFMENCDGFFYSGRTYVNEKILHDVATQYSDIEGSIY